MSWTVSEESFNTREEAYKEYGKSGFNIVIDRVLPNISDARTIARENRGRGRILVPYKSSAIDEGSKKAEKILADIRKVQDDAFQKIFPDCWRILRCFSCPLCNKSENKTAERVSKIIEKANEKLNFLHEKLFSEIAGSEKVRYLACKMVHS